MTVASIRLADPEQDAAACAAIYTPHVEGSAVSFEERAPDPAAMEERISRIAATHPWLVAELDGEVAGYAYACPFQKRPAYRWTAMVSVYVDERRRRAGIGRALYAELFERLRRQRFHIACAGITLPNAASVALHEDFGFVAVGVNREIGWKDGAWRDVGWWQLELAPAPEGPPPEPLPPG